MLKSGGVSIHLSERYSGAIHHFAQVISSKAPNQKKLKANEHPSLIKSAISFSAR